MLCFFGGVSQFIKALSLEKIIQEKKLTLEKQKKNKEQIQEVEGKTEHLKSSYFNQKKVLAFDLLNRNVSLYIELLNTLKFDIESGKGGLLAEFAQNNYKSLDGIKANSFEEFTANFSIDGTF